MRAAAGSVLAAVALVATAAAAEPRVLARVVTGQAPCGAAAGFGRLWVANDGAGTLVAVDPGRNKVVRRARLGGSICAVTIGAGYVWTAAYRGGELIRVDPHTWRVRRVAVGRVPLDALVAAGSVWVTVHDDRTLVRIDPRSLRVVARIALQAEPAGLAVAAGAVWVGSTSPSTSIFRVDPATNQAVAVDLGQEAPAWFAVGRDSLWVTTQDGPGEQGRAVKLDRGNGRALVSLPIEGNPVEGAEARDGTIWIPGKAGNIATRIDPVANRVLDVVGAGRGAYVAVRAAGDMWVTSYAGSDVWRFR